MIDESINESLGLPKGYAISFNEAMKVKERFRVSAFASKNPISNISFIYYEEEYGSFLEPKNHFDVIVKAMFDNLNGSDRFMLLKYFSLEEK